MSLSRIAVHRPVLTVMAALVMILLGGISLYRLPIDLMPDITYPTISVRTEYENASPEEMEELVTRPIEEAMSAVPGVEEVTSNSSEGVSVVRVTFTWGTDLDTAANDIRDRLDRVIPRLPEEADRPGLRKFDLAAFPILILGVSSRLDPIEVRKLIDDQVKNRIERIPGVASLDIHGGLEREIHVDLNPESLKAFNLSIDQLLDRLKDQNINLPAGSLETGNFDVTIRTPGIFTRVDEIRETVVAMHDGDGVPVRLKEVAAVLDTHEKVTRIVRVNGQPGVRMTVSKQSGRNTVEVASGVLAEIRRINADIPQLSIVPIIDTSDFINRSISNVGRTVFYGGLLAVLVLLGFLRNLASTAIIATTIPISVVATFALMYFNGFTLNLMTLGGLALGVGMLVDNAIVVLENIYRLRESGEEPESAALSGAQEVTAAVIASTLTTLAVFLPLIFVRGMSGIMFKQLSYVVGFSLACSLAVALTLVPMLASRVRKAPRAAETDERPELRTVSRRLSALFTGLEDGYRQWIRFSLTHRALMIGGTVLVFVGSLALISLVGVEFMPATDENEVRVYMEMAEGTRLDVLDARFREVEAIVSRHVPEMTNTISFVGGSGWRGQSNTAEMRIALSAAGRRERSSQKIADDLRKPLSGIPGTVIRTRAGQGLFIMRMGAGGEDKVQVEVRGYDLQTADALARRVEEMIARVPGITDTQMSRDSGTPETHILLDRDKAAHLKLTVSEVANTLQTILSGNTAGYFREGGKEYAIRVKVAGADRTPLEDLLDLPVTNADGVPVVLGNVVTVTGKSGPVMIERKDQERVLYVTADFSARNLGAILADVRRGLRQIPVPRDFSVLVAGDYEEQQKAFSELLLSFALAVVLVYMVLASLYESLRYPFVVMFSVPLAAIGVIWMLFLTGTTFNLQSYIGCIMLAGIVVNNAILMVDHINLLRSRDGLGLSEAIEEAGTRRLRPILMTAATTTLAMIPLAFGLGEGGEAQAPMARAIVGGLVSSTLVTLLVVPTIYTFFAVTPRRRAAMAGRPHLDGQPPEKEA